MANDPQAHLCDQYREALADLLAQHKAALGQSVNAAGAADRLRASGEAKRIKERIDEIRGQLARECGAGVIQEGRPIKDWVAARVTEHVQSGAPTAEQAAVGSSAGIPVRNAPADLADRMGRSPRPEPVLASGPAPRRPDSRCPDPATQSLADALDAAYLEEEQLACAGADTVEVRARILTLKRRIREGGRLRVGDFLLHGRYKLVTALGRGGFATIYQAFDTRARRLVAVKVLHGQYGDDKSRVERFFRGARKMAELQHQGIVQVIEPELADEGYHFFVMEFLPGGDLRQCVLNGGIGAERALDLTLAVGTALAFAHAHDIIHRDIKPANIVLDGAGSPKLTDFDLVHAGDTTGGTRTGMLGTYGYAAPEQMQRPQDVDARADVYGLGMTAVFALHGADPSLYEILRNANGFIDSLAVSDRVKSVLSRSIAWEVGERYSSVADFCAALREARQVKPPAVVSRMPPLAVSVPALADPPGTDPDAWPPLGPTPFRDLLVNGAGLGPEMIWLPAGTFRMGSPAGVGADHERPAHDVTLSHYAVGKYPLTVGEFRRFCAATGYRTAAEQGKGAYVRAKGTWEEKKDANWQNPYFAQDDRHPVVCISWQDAQAYCDWLSGETGQTYGLLSEAQWEHACRAGGDGLYCFGDDAGQLTDYAWYGRKTGDGTHPVGRKLANVWGLHDLHGNVWEWCRDWYPDSYQSFVGSAVRTDAPAVSAAHGPRSGPYGDSQSTRTPPSGAAVAASSAAAAASSGEQPLATDPSGPESGSDRVVRGGAWFNTADYCRAAYRNRSAPSHRNHYLGFRLSRTGPLHSYPFTLVPPEPEPEPEPKPEPIPNLRDPLPPQKRSFLPYEVFRDPLEGADRDNATVTGAAPEMVYLPGGTFQMGDEQGGSDERPVHPVRVPAFAMGRTPVTWRDYLRFCETTDSHWPEWLEKGSQYHLETGKDNYYAKRGIGRAALDLPVVGISWDDARAYCAWLSEQSGERYALPTEAQWEYACRAGTATRWYCGDDAAGLAEYAWFSENADGRLHPVGQKQANAWGLYDMHGNCWEWCADWYAADYYEQLTGARAAAASRSERAASGGQQRASGWQRIAKAFRFGAGDAAADASGNPAAASGVQQSASENSSGPKTGSYRVIRGGAWFNPADICRAACRSRHAPSDRDRSLGFRLSRTV